MIYTREIMSRRYDNFTFKLHLNMSDNHDTFYIYFTYITNQNHNVEFDLFMLTIQ